MGFFTNINRSLPKLGRVSSRDAADSAGQSQEPSAPSAAPDGEISLHNRLRRIAVRHFGPVGDTLLADGARASGAPAFDQIPVEQLSAVVDFIATHGGERAGATSAARLAAEIARLQENFAFPARERLEQVLQPWLGRMTPAFLQQCLEQTGVVAGTLSPDSMVRLAEAVAENATTAFGAEVAGEMAAAVRGVRDAAHAELHQEAIKLALEIAGPDGDPMLRSLCKEHLGFELERIEASSMAALAKVVETAAPDLIGRHQTEAFVTNARRVLAGSAKPLRDNLQQVMLRFLGPLGQELVDDLTARRGTPYDQMDQGDLAWLAEALGQEAMPVIGRRQAEEMAKAMLDVMAGPNAA